MMKPLTYLAVIALVVCGALVHGSVTQRWSILVGDDALTARLHAAEVSFRDWHPTEIPTVMPTNERSIATSRRYESASTKQSGLISLISGTPGSVATHTPDVCYPGSGYKTLHGTRKEKFDLPDGRSCECYVADFEKKTQTKNDRVRVRWAWLHEGAWVAPDSPRWQFAGQLRAPTIYKVYIATPLPESESEETLEDDAATKAFVAAAWAQYSAAAFAH